MSTPEFQQENINATNENYEMGDEAFDSAVITRADSRYVIPASRGGMRSPSRIIPPQLPNSVFLSYDPFNKETVEKVSLLRARLVSSGKIVKESTGDFHDDVPEELKMTIKSCVIAVLCITREYKVNMGCQKVARYVCAQGKKVIPLFALLQGDYSETSYPDRISGWLGHMTRDAVTYPCYSNLQISATAACIEGVFVLRKKKIKVDEKEVDKFAQRSAYIKRVMSRVNSPSATASPSLMLENQACRARTPSPSKRRTPSPGPAKSKIYL